MKKKKVEDLRNPNEKMIDLVNQYYSDKEEMEYTEHQIESFLRIKSSTYGDDIEYWKLCGKQSALEQSVNHLRMEIITILIKEKNK